VVGKKSHIGMFCKKKAA